MLPFHGIAKTTPLPSMAEFPYFLAATGGPFDGGLGAFRYISTGGIIYFDQSTANRRVSALSLPPNSGRQQMAHCVMPREKQNASMVSTSLAILVIDENRIRASIIEAGLRETRHDKVTVVHDINGVARTIADINPDVIVIDLENPNRALREQELFPKVDDLVAPTPEEE